MELDLSFISHRYESANHKYLDDCDESTESIFIEYLDANILCEYCMSQSLPYGEFKCVDNFNETKPFDYD